MSAFSIVKGIESLTNRLSVLSLFNEDKVRGLTRELKLQGKKMSSLEENLSKGRADLKWVTNERDKLLEGRRELEQEKKAWEEEKAGMEKELEETRLARDKNADAARVFETDVSTLKTQFENLKAELHAAKVEALEKFTVGFDAATTQVKFLHANLDLGGIGYFKEIIDGELVDPPEDDWFL
ncbi:restin homolog [Cajanus cajan]|uniref:restin homolog n=1 Tax=Cajanus cajan TaxID=3821 RepID=UPI0010FB24B9|nr:restin homolog [Cajanus cajan]XP_029130439.1 restin homolog [Cajanus cajan]